MDIKNIFISHPEPEDWKAKYRFEIAEVDQPVENDEFETMARDGCSVETVPPYVHEIGL